MALTLGHDIGQCELRSSALALGFLISHAWVKTVLERQTFPDQTVGPRFDDLYAVKTYV